tara:strand:+ start:380 stop:787 length:408 start_codon:yes stop_codon:yes gene_type:complete
MKYIENHGGREKYYPTKLKKDRAGDCVVRAIAIATEQDYLEVRDGLFEVAKEIGFMPNDTKTYRLYLERKGWTRKSPLKNGKKKYKVKNIAKFFQGENVIIHTCHHLTTLIDGNLNDTWDCREWKANSYYTKEQA